MVVWDDLSAVGIVLLAASIELVVAEQLFSPLPYPSFSNPLTCQPRSTVVLPVILESRGNLNYFHWFLLQFSVRRMLIIPL